MNSSDKQKVQQAVEILSSLLGGVQVSSGEQQSSAAVPALDDHVAKFTKSSQSLEQPIQFLVIQCLCRPKLL